MHSSEGDTTLLLLLLLLFQSMSKSHPKVINQFTWNAEETRSERKA